MSEFKPVRTLADLDQLDPDDILAGYRAGLRGEPEPGNLHSRGYWHGWRNGRVDAGFAEKDVDQCHLVAEAHREMLGIGSGAAH